MGKRTCFAILHVVSSVEFHRSGRRASEGIERANSDDEGKRHIACKRLRSCAREGCGRREIGVSDWAADLGRTACGWSFGGGDVGVGSERAGRQSVSADETDFGWLRRRWRAVCCCARGRHRERRTNRAVAMGEPHMSGWDCPYGVRRSSRSRLPRAGPPAQKSGTSGERSKPAQKTGCATVTSCTRLQGTSIHVIRAATAERWASTHPGADAYLRTHVRSPQTSRSIASTKRWIVAHRWHRGVLEVVLDLAADAIFDDGTNRGAELAVVRVADGSA